MITSEKELRVENFKNQLAQLASGRIAPEDVVTKILSLEQDYMYKEITVDLKNFNHWAMDAFLKVATDQRSEPEKIERIRLVMQLLAEKKQDSYREFYYSLLMGNATWFKDPVRNFGIVLPLLKTRYYDFDINRKSNIGGENLWVWALRNERIQRFEPFANFLIQQGANIHSALRDHGSGFSLLIMNDTFKDRFDTLIHIGVEPMVEIPFYADPHILPNGHCNKYFGGYYAYLTEMSQYDPAKDSFWNPKKDACVRYAIEVFKTFKASKDAELSAGEYVSERSKLIKAI